MANTQNTVQNPVIDPNTYKNAAKNGPARPPGSDKIDPGKLATEACRVIDHANGWTIATYKNKDDSGGFIVSNGQTAIHLDSNGRIIFSTAAPPQSGCGGQLVMNADHKLEKSKTQTIHITGNPDEERTKDKNGKEETKNRPAYSLMVEGDIAIEGFGEVSIGGDNITLNAKNVLTLKGSEINLEAGNGGGKVNIFSGDVNKNIAFEKIVNTGGSHSEVKGEFTVNQKANPGAVAAINTLGGVNLLVRGDYNISSLGQYQVNALGNILTMSSNGGYANVAPGKSYFFTGGIKEETILGKSLIPPTTAKPLTTYSLTLGPNLTGLALKSAGNIDVKAIGATTSLISPTGIDLIGGVRVSALAAAIYLN